MITILGLYCVVMYMFGWRYFGMSMPTQDRALMWVISPISVPLTLLVYFTRR